MNVVVTFLKVMEKVMIPWIWGMLHVIYVRIFSISKSASQFNYAHSILWRVIPLLILFLISDQLSYNLNYIFT